jgi:hypothetical protein
MTLLIIKVVSDPTYYTRWNYRPKLGRTPLYLLGSSPEIKDSDLIDRKL